MLAVALTIVGILVAVLAFVGQRAADNSIRLLKAIQKRMGLKPAKIPRSPWRIPALVFMFFVSPFVGAMIIVAPEQRRFLVANIAFGAARAAVRRGVFCEHHLDDIHRALQTWVDRYERQLNA